MFPRIITKEIHAYLDYPVGFSLLILPVMLGLGSSSALAFWLSIATGFAALLLTILTDHHLGVFRILPYSFHLSVDGLVGIAFVTLPHLLGFTGFDFWYYSLLGATVLLVVGLHKTDESAQTA